MGSRRTDRACRLEFLLQVRLGGSVLSGVGQTGNACAGRCVELRQRFDRLLNTGLICKSHGITSLLDRPHHLAVARLSHDLAVFSHDGAAHYGQHGSALDGKAVEGAVLHHRVELSCVDGILLV